MLAKMTAKNQLTLPRRITDAIGSPQYFEVALEGERVILTPHRIGGADAVRQRLAELGISEADVTDAVAWARRR